MGLNKSKGHMQRATPVSVLELPLVQGALLDLDLLIQQCQLIVTAYELRTQNVPLTNHYVVLLLLPQLLLRGSIVFSASSLFILTLGAPCMSWDELCSVTCLVATSSSSRKSARLFKNALYVLHMFKAAAPCCLYCIYMSYAARRRAKIALS